DELAPGDHRGGLCEPRGVPERSHLAARLIARAGDPIEAVERGGVQEKRRAHPLPPSTTWTTCPAIHARHGSYHPGPPPYNFSSRPAKPGHLALQRIRTRCSRNSQDIATPRDRGCAT